MTLRKSRWHLINWEELTGQYFWPKAFSATALSQLYKVFHHCQNISIFCLHIYDTKFRPEKFSPKLRNIRALLSSQLPKCCKKNWLSCCDTVAIRGISYQSCAGRPLYLALMGWGPHREGQQCRKCKFSKWLIWIQYVSWLENRKQLAQETWAVICTVPLMPGWSQSQ